MSWNTLLWKTVLWKTARTAAMIAVHGLLGLTLLGSRVGAEERPLAQRIAGRDVAMAFPPLDDPEVRTAAEADHMRPDDVVVGLAMSGAARAYPWWVLKNYHAVNDQFQKVHVLIAFCEQCSAATAFRRDLGNRLLSMETEGVCGGSIILRDRQTDTLWSPFDGEALEGPLVPNKLSRLPVFLTTWREWLARHPDSDVVYDDPRQRGGHGEREHPGKWGIVGQMGETLSTWDTRLSENDFVFGAREGEESRAYPLRLVQQRGGVINDLLAQRPVVVMTGGAFEMAAYDRRVSGRTLTFESREGAIRDVETGTRWDIEGRAIEGQLKGQKIESLDGYMVEWHVWSEYHPDSVIFGLENHQPPSGFQFPVTSLPRLVGEKVRVESLELKAEISLIALWARWCGPCLEKLPLMQRLATEADQRGYRFVSIAVQLPNMLELSSLRNFIYQNKIEWPIYLFEDHQYIQLDELYREQSGRGLVIPTLFITDRSGTVLRALEGSDVDAIDEALKELKADHPG